MRLGARLAAAGLAVAAPLAAGAAPIGFNTALPVHEGGLLFRGQAVWMRLHDDPSPMGRRMDVVAVPSVLVYGATRKLALMAVVPYVQKRLAVGSMGVTRSASGLGDMMTIARQEVFARNGPGRTLRGALFAGLKWPTGRSAVSDSLGLLPKAVQPGSGSYNPLVGTVWTAQWLSAEVDADLSYQRGTWARDFKAGDRLRQDASLQVRLWPRTLAAAGVPSYLYGVLEAANVYQAEDEAGGARDADSGGYQLFVTPGLQWVTERAVVEAAVQVPAVQRLNGGALRSDFNLLGGFRVWL